MEEDKTTHQFKPNSRFEDAVALYNFDIELRDLMFKAVQRLEIALRTNIIQEFSSTDMPGWLPNPFPHVRGQHPSKPCYRT